MEKQDKTTAVNWLKDTAEIVSNIFDAKETIVALATGLALGIAISAGVGLASEKAPSAQACESEDDAKLNEWLQKKSDLKW